MSHPEYTRAGAHRWLRRARELAVIAAFVAGALLAAPAYADGQDKSVIGTWRLTAVLDSSAITALDEKQAQQLVGQLFTIEFDKVRFGGRMCTHPDFEMTVAETNAFFASQAHVSADKLGLPNPVTAVHVDCTFVYKKAPDKLVVHWKGFFFDAVRQRKPVKN
jgi:hypothetical protein